MNQQTWMVNLHEYNFQLKYSRGLDCNIDGLFPISHTVWSQCHNKHVEAKLQKTKVRHIIINEPNYSIEKISRQVDRS